MLYYPIIHLIIQCEFLGGCTRACSLLKKDQLLNIFSSGLFNGKQTRIFSLKNLKLDTQDKKKNVHLQWCFQSDLYIIAKIRSYCYILLPSVITGLWTSQVKYCGYQFYSHK